MESFLNSVRSSDRPTLLNMLSTFARKAGIALSICILLTTSALKFATVIIQSKETAAVLTARNVVFPFFSEAKVLTVAACLELMVVGILMYAKDGMVRFGSLVWLSLGFGLYRYALSSFDGTSSCHCAGLLRATRRGNLDGITLILLGVLVIIGCVGFVLSFLRRRNNRLITPCSSG